MVDGGERIVVARHRVGYQGGVGVAVHHPHRCYADLGALVQRGVFLVGAGHGGEEDADVGVGRRVGIPQLREKNLNKFLLKIFLSVLFNWLRA